VSCAGSHSRRFGGVLIVNWAATTVARRRVEMKEVRILTSRVGEERESRQRRTFAGAAR
jgi:hypothetical protein